MLPEEDLSTSGAQVADAAVFVLLLQQVLTCSVSPLPGFAVAVVMRTFVAPNFPHHSLLLPPDLPVKLPQPVVLGPGAEAGGGGPGEAAGGGDDR